MKNEISKARKFNLFLPFYISFIPNFHPLGKLTENSSSSEESSSKSSKPVIKVKKTSKNIIRRLSSKKKSYDFEKGAIKTDRIYDALDIPPTYRKLNKLQRPLTTPEVLHQKANLRPIKPPLPPKPTINVVEPIYEMPRTPVIQKSSLIGGRSEKIILFTR